MYGANLNFKRASRILEWMEKVGLVKKGSDRYEITKKGNELLRDIYKLGEVFK